MSILSDGKKCYKDQNSADFSLPSDLKATKYNSFLPSDLKAAKYNSASIEAAGQLSTTTVE